jgi:hypothetical protein
MKKRRGNLLEAVLSAVVGGVASFLTAGAAAPMFASIGLTGAAGTAASCALAQGGVALLTGARGEGALKAAALGAVSGGVSGMSGLSAATPGETLLLRSASHAAVGATAAAVYGQDVGRYHT